MDHRTRQSLVCRLSLTALVFFAGTSALWAAGPFPRGPGLYYSPYKLVLLVLSFWGWVKLASWLDEDANNTGMAVSRWNLAYLGTGLMGLLVVLDLPLFYFGMFFFWAAVLGITYLYIHYRNQEVGEADRLMTQQHLLSLLERLSPRFARKGGDAAPMQKIPIRFMSRSAQHHESDSRRLD